MIAELTAAAAAAATTTALTGYLTASATKAAEAIGESAVEAGKGLLGWLKGKLTGDAKEALSDLKLEPGEAAAATFQTALERALAADPTLLAALSKQLATLPGPTVQRFGDQTLTQTGDGNKGAQGVGENITISIK